MFDQEVARAIKNAARINKEFLKWAVGEFMRTNQAEEPFTEYYYTVEQVNKMLLQIVSEVDHDMSNEGGY